MLQKRLCYLADMLVTCESDHQVRAEAGQGPERGRRSSNGISTSSAIIGTGPRDSRAVSSWLAASVPPLGEVVRQEHDGPQGVPLLPAMRATGRDRQGVGDPLEPPLLDAGRLAAGLGPSRAVRPPTDQPCHARPTPCSAGSPRRPGLGLRHPVQELRQLRVGHRRRAVGGQERVLRPLRPRTPSPGHPRRAASAPPAFSGRCAGSRRATAWENRTTPAAGRHGRRRLPRLIRPVDQMQPLPPPGEIQGDVGERPERLQRKLQDLHGTVVSRSEHSSQIFSSRERTYVFLVSAWRHPAWLGFVRPSRRPRLGAIAIMLGYSIKQGLTRQTA